MTTVTSIRSTSTAVLVEGAIEWPCLARSLLPRQAASNEVLVRVSFCVQGTPEQLHGSVRVSIAEAPTSGRCDAMGDVQATWPRTLLERPTRAVVSSVGDWTALELRTDGGPSADVLVRSSMASEHNGSAYVRTDLPLLLGLEGGRYGCPRVILSVQPATEVR